MFVKETKGDVLIEIVNIERATLIYADEFRHILLKDIEDGWRKIIIDLTANSFMDSSFLGSIVIALKTISKLGGDLRIAAAHGDSHAVLELTGTSRVLKAFNTCEEAVLSFKDKKIV